MDNCELDFDSMNSDRDIIIVTSGGKLSMVPLDTIASNDSHFQQTNQSDKIQSLVEIDTRNFCGWDGNCKLGEPDIVDVALDVASLNM